MESKKEFYKLEKENIDRWLKKIKKANPQEKQHELVKFAFIIEYLIEEQNEKKAN